MSTAVKVKKPFLPQRKPTGPVGSSVAVSPQANSRAATASVALTVGGEPRVHLLPGDVVSRKQGKLLKRRIATGVLAVVVLIGVGYGAGALALTTAQTQLEAAQNATSQLLVQEAKYGQVNKIKADIASIGAAQKTATAQEILWTPFTTALEGSLPAGASITDLDASIDSPFTTPNTQTAPLIGTHVATVQATVSMAETSIAPWLTTLPKLKGFVADTPDSVKGTDPTSNYVVVVTIYLDDRALSNRFSSPAGGTN